MLGPEGSTLCHAVDSCEAGAGITPISCLWGNGVPEVKSHRAAPFLICQRKLPTDEARRWLVTLLLGGSWEDR